MCAAKRGALLSSRVHRAEQPPLWPAGHRLKSTKGLARRVIQALSIKWLLLLTGAITHGCGSLAELCTMCSAVSVR